MEIRRFHEVTGKAVGMVATIGFFDGVHLGHVHLIENVKKEAAQRGMESMVITFSRHPRQVIDSSWRPQLLTTLEEKTTLLRQTGIDVLVIVDFDKRMAALSAHDFMQNVLQQQLNVKMLLTGYDNHFGHRGAASTEGFDDYVRYGKEMGIVVKQGTELKVEDKITASSSEARRAITRGDISLASALLGRQYSIEGEVIDGERIGRKLGFPTANLRQINTEKIIPSTGVYGVWVDIKGIKKRYQGMMNIGMRPTFDGDHQTLEVHLIDFQGNLYRKILKVTFVEKLRDEQTFNSPEALKEQLTFDEQRVRNMLEQHTKDIIFKSEHKKIRS